MGDFTLGCLLGLDDGAQSFDVASVALGASPYVNSWQPIGTTSAAFVAGGTTNVHSSLQGARIDVESRGGDARFYRYMYGQANDLYTRWFPDVTTHAARLDCWVRTLDTVSGQLRITLQDVVNGPIGNAATIAQVVNMTPVRLSSTVVRSTESVEENLSVNLTMIAAGSMAPISFEIDDVLTQIDPVTLYPEWEFQELSFVRKGQHRTLGGHLNTYSWQRHFAYSVPLTTLSTSHADLLNWWWENQFNLAFTLDTDDANSFYIVRIVNERQPIGKRHRPYNTQWDGELQLESINEGRLSW